MPYTTPPHDDASVHAARYLRAILSMLALVGLLQVVILWQNGRTLASVSTLAERLEEVTSVTLKINCPDGTTAGTITVDQDVGETFTDFVTRAADERAEAVAEFCDPATG